MTAKQETTAEERALRYLAVRAHFRHELAKKLARHRHPPEEIAAVLAKLERLGYLDETKIAREFVAARRRRGPEGRRRLAAELRKRGAPAEASDRALDDAGSDPAAPPDSEAQLARQAADKWRARRPLAADRDRAALARHLDRRGFGPATIWRVIGEIAGGDAGEEPSGEDPTPDS